MIKPKLSPKLKHLVDEYSDLIAKTAAWRPAVNPHLARLVEVTGEIVKLSDLQPADAELLFVGYNFVLPVGMRRIKRTIINLPKLFKRLGAEWVEAHCQPGLGELDKVLQVEERAEFIEESRELSRIIGRPVMAEAVRKAA